MSADIRTIACTINDLLLHIIPIYVGNHCLALEGCVRGVSLLKLYACIICVHDRMTYNFNCFGGESCREGFAMGSLYYIETDSFLSILFVYFSQKPTKDLCLYSHLSIESKFNASYIIRIDCNVCYVDSG